MRTVHKFILDGISKELPLTKDAVPVHIGEQDGQVVMWVDYCTTDARINRTFIIFGTGHKIECGSWAVCKYVGTVQMRSELVWHVYEEQLHAAT